ncbi:MAG TPA: BamA/TamA family outer membrane protein [Candidatus Hydrogenedentes bacterium]|nr:BamA/TamA family outer membrane protein [Candidatus Hydrogenedentota bacterium]
MPRERVAGRFSRNGRQIVKEASFPRFFSAAFAVVSSLFLLFPFALSAGVQVEIIPMEQPHLQKVLESYSPMLWPGEGTPETETLLKGYAHRHEERLKDALHAAGYYDAVLEMSVQWGDETSRVIYRVAPGNLYHFGSILLEMATPREEMDLFALETVLSESTDLKKGSPALADSVLTGEKQLLRMLGNGGFPFARITDRKIRIDRENRTLHVTFVFDSGQHLLFGALRVEGLDSIRLDAVERELPWMRGAPFQISLLEEGQAKLQKTGLFSIVRLHPAPEAEAVNGHIPIVAEVIERRHRTIHAGLQYRSDEGIGAGFEWEHRNFLEMSRRLRVQGQITEMEQALGAVYDIQQYRRSDQNLTLHTRIRQLQPERYQSRRIEAGAWLERIISPTLVYGLGPSLRMGRVQSTNKSDSYFLALFPFEVRYDQRDNPLDSHSGFQLTNRLTPFWDVTNKNVFFAKNEMNFSYFIPFGEEQKTVLATRLRLGSLGGAASGMIPVDERFFAGGGGSVRGYAYQNIGPLDSKGKPMGGRSLTDWSIELRRKLSEKIGVVAFVDGGMSYKTPFPDFGTAPRWGAGIGLRYSTPLGPLRLDVAVPVNRRKDLDSSVQLYMSIGQAF